MIIQKWIFKKPIIQKDKKMNNPAKNIEPLLVLGSSFF
jgi:hypothetical protein